MYINACQPSPLPFISIGALTTPGCYPEGQLLVGLTRLDCVGSEESLLDCQQGDVVQDECGSFEVAAVVCQGD